MSDAITLTLRSPLDSALRLDVVQPHRFAELSQAEIGRLPIFLGRQPAQLGDLFTVDGERSPRVILRGSTRLVHAVGAGMVRGELLVEGDVGDDAGEAMCGGVLQITGTAGDRVGSASPGASKGMTGGEIIVRGSVGAEAGARTRRGLIVVGGATGPNPARAMIAGSLVVLGACGANPGRGSKRGTIIACHSIAIPTTYRYACTFEPPHVRLTLRYLHHRYGLEIAPDIMDGRYRRYCGDAGDPGKGEILEYAGRGERP